LRNYVVFTVLIFTYLLNNLLHVTEKFPAFYGTQKFITAFTSARQLYLF
jgi:hypothetical protein